MSLQPTTLVIFDVDGTLLLNRTAVREAFMGAFREVTGTDHNHPGPHFAGMTDRGIFRTLLEVNGVEGDFASLFMAFEARLADILRATYPTHPDPYLLPGVRALLEALKDRPEVVLALGTGNCRSTCAIKLERFEIGEFFPVGGFGGDFEDRTEVIREAMRQAQDQLGWDGSTAWVIGDTDRDVAAAHAAGAKALAVATGPVPREKLVASNPDALLEDLSDTTDVLKHLGLE